jgi:hypothetical protein
MLAVRKADGLGDLPHQAEAQVVRDVLFPLDEKVVEPDGGGEMLKDDGRAEFMVGEFKGAKDAAMLKRLKKTEFPFGGALNDDSLVGVCFCLHQVNPDSPKRVLQRNVFAEEILVPRSFINDALQFVIANPAASLRRLDADLFEGTREGLCHRAVERATRLL